ncbi:hypothetical protein AQUCO_15500003v1 [Aquilegia coerulea]|uniref:Peptidase S8/S53 domain-containing protein n=1 Tax=Aquilegia coerulea TaxID=218851 RepID=A0A2G5C0T8_AQUCA|nr:hypothetical protein AQUCO_15500003v1 [Aquilegia coerulea]
MPPCASRWRGQCQAGEAFNASSCNRKVIGLPRDTNGHGSHTASIAAGQYVMDMNFKGLAAGGARGDAPMARIALPKTCWDSGCYDVDLLAAFDDAIKDGVDIISLSLGPDAPQGDYFNDAISMMPFHAANRGILVVSSVGNEGNQGSATNLAAWLITVAASSTDRDFISSINLVDETNYTVMHLIPTAHISPAKTVIGSQPAPRVASFSSKGPNALTPAILKPYVTAPGLNILAAWSPATGNMDFNVLSGTSMACPHVTGIAALIKSVYPSWSPSAIKSAIMTTATILDKKWKHIPVDPTGRRGNPFDYGAGFVNPTKVLNPGLVYDSQPLDYKKFLRSIGYKEKSLHLITRDNSTCNQNFSAASNLNYPSITLSDLRDSCSVARSVTNVGQGISTYRVFVSLPAGVKITVSPRILLLKEYGQKMSFTVNFKVTALAKGYVFGWLAWKKGKLRVTSPLVVRVVSSRSGLMR